MVSNNYTFRPSLHYIYRLAVVAAEVLSDQHSPSPHNEDFLNFRQILKLQKEFLEMFQRATFSKVAEPLNQCIAPTIADQLITLVGDNREMEEEDQLPIKKKLKGSGHDAKQNHEQQQQQQPSSSPPLLDNAFERRLPAVLPPLSSGQQQPLTSVPTSDGGRMDLTRKCFHLLPQQADPLVQQFQVRLKSNDKLLFWIHQDDTNHTSSSPSLPTQNQPISLTIDNSDIVVKRYLRHTFSDNPEENLTIASEELFSLFHGLEEITRYTRFYPFLFYFNLVPIDPFSNPFLIILYIST
jgi:hypothetical protein